MKRGAWTLFVDKKKVGDNILKGTNGASTAIQGIVFNITRNYRGGTSETSLDNIVIRDDLDLHGAPSGQK